MKDRGRGSRGLGFRRDAELEVGSNAHYEDVAYYAKTYADRTEDVAYYVELAASHGGPVLEYGCGSGRIALPLARLGLSVTGIARSATMLQSLRRQAAKETGLDLTVRRGDMRTKRLGERFALVLCTFNTFLHLYTRQDVERFCARVREHLAPSGTFVVDVTVPSPEELDRKPERLHRTSPFKHPSGEVVRYGERFHYDPLRQVSYVSMEFEPKGSPERGWRVPLTQRQFFPQELEALLHYNGLEVTEVHSNFIAAPPEPEPEELIYHCRRRRGFRRP